MMQPTQLNYLPKLMNKQKGLVLFVALIALLAMSLAAAALIRSVDTSVLVAGNLAFKQSATLAADNGIETAFSWITDHPNLLEADLATEGFYATQAKLGSEPDLTWFKDEDIWDDNNSRLAEGNGYVAGLDTLTGNTVRYVIQRMCNATGAANQDKCLFGSGATKTSSLGVKENSELGAIVLASLSPMYRVTARVTGPKNTTSYVQAFFN